VCVWPKGVDNVVLLFRIRPNRRLYILIVMQKLSSWYVNENVLQIFADAKFFSIFILLEWHVNAVFLIYEL